MLEYEIPQELLLEPDEVVAIKTSLPLAKVRRLKQQLAKSFCCASNILNMKYKDTLSSGIDELDLCLGGGIPCNQIVELYGPAAAGKTHLCLQTISRLLKHDQDRNALFISTQERFPIEVLAGKLPNDYLDRLHLEYFLDPSDELHFLQYGLPALMDEFKYKLIVLDGIASNSRIIEDPLEKSKHVNSCLAAFRNLFAFHNLCCIITNQIAEVPSGDESKIIRSSLGLALENNINIKIFLDYNRGGNLRLWKIEKSSHCPHYTGRFAISKEGAHTLSRDDFP